MRIMSVALAVASLIVSTGPVFAQLEIVALEGDVLPGSGPDFVTNFNAPFTNGLGEVGFTGTLESPEGETDRFIFSGDAVVWRNSDAVGYTLGGAEGTMGISDDGGFIYSPSIDGEDGVWTEDGLLLRGTEAAPGIPGEFITFCSRPTMLPDGTAHWVSGLNPNPGGGSVARVLYRATDAGIEPLLKSGDVVDGFQVQAPDGIGFDHAFTRSGTRSILSLLVETGSSDDDDAIAVGGNIVAREGQPSGSGDNWDNFDSVTINDAGSYAFSGDTDGPAASDEFIAVNGAIVLREGDVLDGRTLGSAVGALSISDSGVAVFIWSTDAGETLFAGEVGDLAGTSVAIARVGDQIDDDGDRVGDYEITDFNASNIIGPGLWLADDGFVYAEVDVDDLDTGLELEAIIRVSLPASCAADIDGSGDVGFDDLLEVLSNWGPCAGCPGDVTGDDEVGFDDLLEVLSNWGPCPG